MAKTILTKDFQESSALTRVLSTVRLNMDVSQIRQCALDSMATFKASAESGDLVPEKYGRPSDDKLRSRRYL